MSDMNKIHFIFRLLRRLVEKRGEEKTDFSAWEIRAGLWKVAAGKGQSRYAARTLQRPGAGGNKAPLSDQPKGPPWE